jgi:ABC-2 type transport system ATP-binding protein
MLRVIRVEHLTKRFGRFTAIEDVSFTVAGGEIVGFLGPNGAGKSTTMRILAGVFPPSRGAVSIAGYDVVRESLRARSIVGYFPERIALYTDMTVSRYLRYVARMKELPQRRAREEVDVAIGSCGLEPVASRLVGSLSKGFRQRIGIAQALVGSPRVLILDEPTAGLDPEQVADVRALIRKLRGDRTVILSTHILSEVEATCDRVMIIHRGRILAVDTAANLNRRLRHASQVYLEVHGPKVEVLAAVRSVAGVVDVEPQAGNDGDVTSFVLSTTEEADLRETLAARITERGWGLRELRPVTLSLEEIFLSLITARPSDSPKEARVEGVHHLPS